MCYSDRSIPSDSVLTLNSEKQPLLLKKKNKHSSSSNTTHFKLSAFNTSISTMKQLLHNILNKLAYISSIVGICYYCRLVAKGAYATWGIPLFISACICKLISTPSQQKSALQRRGILSNTIYSQIKTNPVYIKLSDIFGYLKRILTNDNNSNLYILSIAIVILPCFYYFATKLQGHINSFSNGLTEMSTKNHTKLANDFGKLASVAFTFLLLPVSKSSSLLSTLKLSEVHIIRMHIITGLIVLGGSIIHGLYYTIIWIKFDKYKYNDVFPTRADGCFTTNYNTGCYDKYINTLGIISGLALVILAISSLYYIRRHYYKVFYTIHIIVSISILFGLCMHYNKMIYYMLPSLVYYIGSNLPIWIEGVYKYVRLNGVQVKKVVCIPDSGGCVELSFAYPTNSDGSSTMEDTIGKYASLCIPEISYESHPFTTFSFTSSSKLDNMTSPATTTASSEESTTIKILFRPSGNFTTSLSKRLKSLTLAESTSHEIQDHQKCPPKMLINGIRSATNGNEMLSNVLDRFDHTLIIAGGVGIVTYISLLGTILQYRLQQEQQQEEEMFENDMSNDISNNNGGIIKKKKNRIVDIHWMSRDEGLIRHVLANYFEPFSSTSSENRSNDLSINLVIHHTSPHSSSNGHSNGGSSEPPTIWQPNQQHHSMSNNSNQSYASPTSTYESPQVNISQNILPTITFASVLIGSIYITNYCYDNIQSKHVFETRTISVIGIILLSIGISLVLNIISLIGKSVYGRLFVYTKIEEEGSSDDYVVDNDDIEENGMEDQVRKSEIELSNGDERFVIDDNDEVQLSASSSTTTMYDNSILRISHCQGRPNLSVIVQDVMKGNGEQVEDLEVDQFDSRDGSSSNDDVGIYMCGPTVMTDSVWRAVKEENPSVCNAISNGAKQVAVYQEVFEL